MYKPGKKPPEGDYHLDDSPYQAHKTRLRELACLPVAIPAEPSEEERLAADREAWQQLRAQRRQRHRA